MKFGAWKEVGDHPSLKIVRMRRGANLLGWRGLYEGFVQKLYVGGEEKCVSSPWVTNFRSSHDFSSLPRAVHIPLWTYLRL